MGNVDKSIPVEQWTERYSWAYVDAAKAQLGQLLRGMREGTIRPSVTDTVRLNAALDDLTVQAVMLRQMLADITAQDKQYQRWGGTLR